MDREFIAGLRGFSENAAFVGGGLVTWFVSWLAPGPTGTGGPPELWWYAAIVFLVFFGASVACTLALMAKDKAEEARRRLHDDVRTQTLKDILADIRSLKDQTVSAPKSATPVASPQPLTAPIASKEPKA